MRWRTLIRRMPGAASMRIGRVSRLSPLSRDFGFSRGTPIDRYYIERFLQGYSGDIRGAALEIGDDSYCRMFGGDRIDSQDVLHIEGGRSGATITGDLAAPETLPLRTFDCVILTQTLHLILDPAAAVAHLRHALKPGGILLITVPGVSSVDRGEWGERWCWSMTERSLHGLLATAFDPNEVSVATYGNLFAATAFLHGASVEDTGTARLDPLDPSYPVIVAAGARAS